MRSCLPLGLGFVVDRLSLGESHVGLLPVLGAADARASTTLLAVGIDHLHALHELADHFRGVDLRNGVVVSPDLGNAKEASRFAGMLGVPVAAAAKERLADDKVVISSIIGDVRGRDVIVLDDEIARGSTIIELLDRLAELDVASVRLACTHGLFADGALARISERDAVLEIVCTTTVPLADTSTKLTEISIAPALAEAMRRIHNGESVSVLFDEH